MDQVASMFSMEHRKPAKPKMTPEVIRGARQDIAKTFKVNPERDLNSKIKKALGLE